MNDAVLWLWMQRLFGCGTRRAHEALFRFGTPQKLIELPGELLTRDDFLTKEEKKAVMAADFSEETRLFEKAVSLGWTALTPDCGGYPARLREIYSPPFLLWAKGKTELLFETYAAAVVGTRHPDAYGERAARKISTELALGGGVVVSGFANGIDLICHESALSAGGDTIAVLACGPDVDYPFGREKLRERIAGQGLLLTEFAPGTPVRRGTFQIRNRLLSGLSLAVIVVQAAHRSGALITAGHALAQNRDLYAVCGDIFSPKMAGCHKLLTEGASPVFSGLALLRGYEAVYGEPLSLLCPEEEIAARADPAPEKHPAAKSDRPRTQKKTPPAPKSVPAFESDQPPASLNEKQERVWRACRSGAGMDEICESAGLGAGEVLSVLTQLEIFGLAQPLPGGRYRSLHP